MKTLYWHRYAAKGRGTFWYLCDRPSGGLPGMGLVRKSHVASFDTGRAVWCASVHNLAGCSIANAQLGSAAAAKRYIEREIDKRSVGLFNEDEVEFVK